MKNIRLWFTGFYEGFSPENNFLYTLLSNYYSIELDKENPEYLIYSCYDNNFLNYDCIRIFYTGENIKPDFNLCDYAIGFDYIDFGDRYLRYPNFAFFEDQFENLVISEEKDPVDILSSKKYFCNFIYSNANADPARDKIFYLLSRYKKVASAGKHLNNTPMFIGERYSNDWMYSKIAFQSSCKFSIAFENASSPGYTTEKLLHAFIAETIPIYWGNPEVTKDFNSKALINCNDYKSFEEVVERVKEVDTNDKEYISMIKEPPFLNNIMPMNLRRHTLSNFLQNIFNQERENAFRRARYGTVKNYEDELKKLLVVKNRFKRLNSFIERFKQ